jgi:hypothetical protein
MIYYFRGNTVAMPLVVLLEDDSFCEQVLTTRLHELGYAVGAYSSVGEAVDGAVHDAHSYFLDMRVPLRPGEDAVHRGGPEFGEYLLSRGVDPRRIVYMSNTVSLSDVREARGYGISPERIVEKADLTTKKLEELLSSATPLS